MWKQIEDNNTNAKLGISRELKLRYWESINSIIIYKNNKHCIIIDKKSMLTKENVIEYIIK